MRRLIFNRRAERDLSDIWDYIAADNPPAADKLVSQIETALDLLLQKPQIGHRRTDVTNPKYLFHVVGSYVIGYRATRQSLYVVRVVHGRRDFRRIFK